MRPYLQFSLLCDDVGRTGEGKVIIHGVFETIVAQSFPVVHRACYVCNRWSGGAGTFREKVRMTDSEGKATIMETPETQFTLRSRASCHTVICRLGGLSFEKPGVYYVHVLLDDAVVCEYALAVREAEATPKGGPNRPEREGKPPIQD